MIREEAKNLYKPKSTYNEKMWFIDQIFDQHEAEIASLKDEITRLNNIIITKQSQLEQRDGYIEELKEQLKVKVEEGRDIISGRDRTIREHKQEYEREILNLKNQLDIAKDHWDMHAKNNIAQTETIQTLTNQIEQMRAVQNLDKQYTPPLSEHCDTTFTNKLDEITKEQN